MLEETPQDAKPEDTQAAPDTTPVAESSIEAIPVTEPPAAIEASEASVTSSDAPVDTTADAVMADAVTQEQTSADVAENVPAVEAVAETPVDAVDTSVEQTPAAVEALAEPVVDADLEAAAAPVETPDTADESFVIPAKVTKTRKKTSKPKAVAATGEAGAEGEAKPARRSSRKKEKLPDLGDGSGYIAPDEADLVLDDVPWFAVHCYSGQENKVKHNLEQRIETMGMAGKILKIIVPTEDEIEVRDGKRKTVKRQVFPGYVLVQMTMSEESWFVVRNTPGVTRFVGMGNRPQPLTQNEVNVLLGRMEAEAPKIKINFRAGQKVRITDGPFADFIGVVDKIDTERAKVVALVSFFGRETPVELDFLQVEKT
jgi:transcription termination/antitermination protein NusG